MLAERNVLKYVYLTNKKNAIKYIYASISQVLSQMLGIQQKKKDADTDLMEFPGEMPLPHPFAFKQKTY